MFYNFIILILKHYILEIINIKYRNFLLYILDIWINDLKIENTTNFF